MRILLADSDSRVCSALTMLLKCQPGWRVVGQSRNTTMLLAQANELEPNLIILDWELPGNSSTNIVDTLHNVKSHPKVIAISGRPESERDAIKKGADAFVSKVDPPDSLLGELERLLTRQATL